MRLAVRQWAEALAPGMATLSEEDSEFEIVFVVTPANPLASSLQLRIGRDGKTFDVAVGRAMQFDDVPSNLDSLRHVLEAVRHGGLRESVLEVSGHVAQSRGFLNMGGTKWFSRRTNVPRLVQGLFFPKTRFEISYQPYDAAIVR